MQTFHRLSNSIYHHEEKNKEGAIVAKAWVDDMPSINAAKKRSRMMQKNLTHKYVRPQ